jgi:hypothetical protein
VTNLSSRELGFVTTCHTCVPRLLPAARGRDPGSFGYGTRGATGTKASARPRATGSKLAFLSLPLRSTAAGGRAFRDTRHTTGPYRGHACATGRVNP